MTPIPACVVCGQLATYDFPARCREHRDTKFKRLCVKCGKDFWTRNQTANRHRSCPSWACVEPAPTPAAGTTPTPAASVDTDRAAAREQKEVVILRSRYKEALERIDNLESELDSSLKLGASVDTFEIKPHLPSGTAEGTCLWVASDWHIEENVVPQTINGLNEYNMAIATERSKRFFTSAMRLTNMFARDIKIKTVVLALLGDFASNDIHDELVETAELLPIHAYIAAQNMIASGIEHVLAHSEYDLVIPCKSGNHARTTKRNHFATEAGHSLEFYMYSHLANYFKRESRVKFLISEGYHQYLDIYNTRVRFHHGHSIRYQGGVGGIYIPTNKAIAQWNKAKPVDLDVFGHWHQFRDGGNFLLNGSMIGYNAFALANKFDFEPPKQIVALFDKKRGRTGVWPVLFER